MIHDDLDTVRAALAPSWDDAREDRVLVRVLAESGRRERRGRAARWGVGAVAVALSCLVLPRAGRSFSSGEAPALGGPADSSSSLASPLPVDGGTFSGVGGGSSRAMSVAPGAGGNAGTG